MRQHLKIILFSLILFVTGGTASAQKKSTNATPMYYQVMPDGDTVYLDQIPPVWVFPKGSRVDRVAWRKYCRLVYNFNYVYPYALMAARIEKDADNYIASNHLTKKERSKYVNMRQRELWGEFEHTLTHMTVSQGQLLVKLIDREVGQSGYDIIKNYKNGFSAGMWQGVAFIFGQNLKKTYDRNGDDKLTEELVRKWERGEFEELYFSIFFVKPPKTKIPEKYL